MSGEERFRCAGQEKLPYSFMSRALVGIPSDSGLRTYIDIGAPSGTRNAIVALAE